MDAILMLSKGSKFSYNSIKTNLQLNQLNQTND